MIGPEGSEGAGTGQSRRTLSFRRRVSAGGEFRDGEISGREGFLICMLPPSGPPVLAAAWEGPEGAGPKRLGDPPAPRVTRRPWRWQRERRYTGSGEAGRTDPHHFRMSLCFPPPHSQPSGLKLAEFTGEKEGTIADTSAPSAFGAACHNGC